MTITPSGWANACASRRRYAANTAWWYPHALVDELLQRLFGITVPARHTDASTQRLDALALAIQQQSLQVHAGPVPAGDQPKVRDELANVLLESLNDLRIQLRHRRARHIPTLELDRNTPVVV